MEVAKAFTAVRLARSFGILVGKVFISRSLIENGRSRHAAAWFTARESGSFSEVTRFLGYLSQSLGIFKIVLPMIAGVLSDGLAIGAFGTGRKS
ncbi:hypothetical protein [Paracoccus actinidiae]|uniref:hypothetical protein n=1 Tax=Paracoccus actinidiae TaxID=3064531 RepID=UPI0027D31CFA|nr:hypothetical protein [Paracoccus sp. M09]